MGSQLLIGAKVQKLVQTLRLRSKTDPEQASQEVYVIITYSSTILPILIFRVVPVRPPNQR